MIQPVAYRRKLEGKSNAHLIAFDDGREYVVKFFQEGFERTLPNEWLSYCLARYLGLPVPFSRMVEIPADFIAKSSELSEVMVTQYQFASLYVPDCLNGHEVSDIISIVNNETLAAVILFDYWMGNRDRTRKNILFQNAGQNFYQMWIIDHAEVLGSYNWQIDKLESIPTGIRKSAAHQLMATFTEREDAFSEALELIQTIPIFLIEEIVAVIPEDWQVTKEERKSMVTALLKRRTKMLPKLMARYIKKVYRPLQEKLK